jgi:hypothetical protein
MLVLDAFKEQLIQEVKGQISTGLVISGSMTLQLQVLDVVVNEPVQDHF